MAKTKEKPRTETILLDRIETRFTKTRCGIRERAVEEYAELIAAGEEMDPIVVFETAKGQFLLGAGQHRIEAHRKAGKTRAKCEVRQGEVWDAIEFGIADNQKHNGERLTRDDKAHNVKLVLKYKPEWSDRKVADKVGVSHHTVGNYRAEMAGQLPSSNKRTGLDGKDRPASKPNRPKIVQGETASVEVPQPTDNRAAIPHQDSNRAEEDKCRCGAEWESDGEGYRFCPECNAEHPDNVKPEPNRRGDRRPKLGPARIVRELREALKYSNRLCECIFAVQPSDNSPLSQEIVRLTDEIHEKICQWGESIAPELSWRPK